MLSRFLEVFHIDKKIEYSNNFYKDFFVNLGGMQFGDGIFSTIRLEDADKWEEYLVEAFPRLKGKILPFGYTWDGIFMCVDMRDGKIIICDVGASHCYALPISLNAFLNEELAEYHEEFFCASDYKQWIAAYGPLPYGYCVGWKIPLFLNGAETMENRELSDMEVYWGVFGQIREQVMGDDYGQSDT